MKVKYIGKDFTEVFGLAFKPNETVDVSDPFAIAKLSRNPLFKPEKEPEGLPAAISPTPELVRLAEQERVEKMAEVNRTILADIERKKREG